MTAHAAPISPPALDDLAEALRFVRAQPRLSGGGPATVAALLLGLLSLAILPIPLFLTAIAVLAARRALALADGRSTLRPAAPGAYARVALLLAPVHGAIGVVAIGMILAATGGDEALAHGGLICGLGLLALAIAVIAWWPAVGPLLLLTVDAPLSLADLSREAGRARAGQGATLAITMAIHAAPLVLAPPLLAIGALLPLSFAAHTLLMFLSAGAVGLAPVFQAIRLRRAQRRAGLQP
jgi:hypothetical protein